MEGILKTLRRICLNFKFKIFCYFLLFFCSSLHAAELSVLLGKIARSANGEHTYTYSLQYKQKLAKYLDASIAYINEGHFSNHHRDGFAVQLWGHTKPFNNHLVLAAGIGPYYSYDTDLSGGGPGFKEVHSLGGILSLAGLWTMQNPWVIQLQSNYIKTDHFDTYSAMLGLGYRLNYHQEHNTFSSERMSLENMGNNEVTVSIAQAIINSRKSPRAAAQSIEYRRHINSYLDLSAAFINEGNNDLADRDGVLLQAWLVRNLLNNHLFLGAGLGPYVSLDRRHQNEGKVSGAVSLAVGYQLNPNWLVRLYFNRMTTDHNRDSDVFVIGPGFRF